MTVEMAAFYRRMLSVGLSDAYQRDIGLALETEAPPSDLLLELAFCLSDPNKTISVLDRYIGDRIPDEDILCPMILDEIKKSYSDGRMDLEEAAKALFWIVDSQDLEFEGPWMNMIRLSYDYNEARCGYIPMEHCLDDLYVELFEKRCCGND